MPDFCENKLYVVGGAKSVEQFDRDINNQNQTILNEDERLKASVKKGYCTHWNDNKGYGFISGGTRDWERTGEWEWDGDDELEDIDDVFVHFSQIDAKSTYSRSRKLEIDESVEFQLKIQRDGRAKAINVTGGLGNYEGLNHYRTEPKLKCFGLKSAAYSKGKVYTFSTYFSPPEPWLQAMSAKYITLRFRLNFQTENPERFGHFVYERGVRKERRFADLHGDIWTKHTTDELLAVLNQEIRNLFEKPVRSSLRAQGISDAVQTEIIDFCGLVEWSTSSEFIKLWHEYAEGKVTLIEAKASNPKQTRGKPLRSARYQIEIVTKDSPFLALFRVVHKTIDWILEREDIEVLDYRMGIQYPFWQPRGGYFAGLVKMLLIDEQ